MFSLTIGWMEWGRPTSTCPRRPVDQRVFSTLWARAAGLTAPPLTIGSILAATPLSPAFSWTGSALSDLGVAPETAAVFNGGLPRAGAGALCCTGGHLAGWALRVGGVRPGPGLTLPELWGALLFRSWVVALSPTAPLSPTIWSVWRWPRGSYTTLSRTARRAVHRPRSSAAIDRVPALSDGHGWCRSSRSTDTRRVRRRRSPCWGPVCWARSDAEPELAEAFAARLGHHVDAPGRRVPEVDGSGIDLRDGFGGAAHVVQ